MVEGAHRPAWVEVDLAAVRRNVRLLCAIASPARLCAVVKADGYGHGAVGVARAALEGGATELAVALVDEGVELREAGIEAPILVLSEPSADAMEEAIRRRLTPTLYTPEGVSLSAAAVRAAGSKPAGVEIKVDTGMHRVGVGIDTLVALVQALETQPGLALAGLWTHLAVADEPGNPFTAEQLRRYSAARVALADAGLPAGDRAHVANSAGAIAWPDARLDLVRCGISIYGYAPSRDIEPILAAEADRAAARRDAQENRGDDVLEPPAAAAGERGTGDADAGVSLPFSLPRSAGTGRSRSPTDTDTPRLFPETLPAGLEPALAWKARIKPRAGRLPAGERVSYGLRRPLSVRSVVATVPLGYADGIPRAYFDAGGKVLVGGCRRRLAGAVTMDQIVVDCGDDRSVQVGDEVVLIGSQGDSRITASDWAERLGTIHYEIVTRIGSRVKRVYRDSSAGREESAR